MDEDWKSAAAGRVTACVAVVCATMLAVTGLLRISGHSAQRPHIERLHGKRQVIAAASTPTVASGAQAPECQLPVPTGSVLQQRWGILRAAHGNRLAVQNPFRRNAIVKLRDVMLGDTRLALFVAANSTIAYNHVPDGAYILEYAVGDRLDETCTTFTRIAHAGIVGIYRPTPIQSAPATSLVANTVAVPDPNGQNGVIDSISSDTFNFN